MAKIERFEDIDGWQAARELMRMVYAVSTKGSFAKDYRLRDQIQGSAISVMSNIAEGFDVGGDAEFIRFLGYACRSASELQSQLYIDQQQFSRIYRQAVETKRLIGGFIRYLKKSQVLGPKS
jgi:four helix bundle protein